MTINWREILEPDPTDDDEDVACPGYVKEVLGFDPDEEDWERVDNAGTEDELRDYHGKWTKGDDIPTSQRPKLRDGLYPKSAELHEAAHDEAKALALFKRVAPKERGKLTRLIEALRTPTEDPGKNEPLADGESAKFTSKDGVKYHITNKSGERLPAARVESMRKTFERMPKVLQEVALGVEYNPRGGTYAKPGNSIVIGDKVGDSYGKYVHEAAHNLQADRTTGKDWQEAREKDVHPSGWTEYTKMGSEDFAESVKLYVLDLVPTGVEGHGKKHYRDVFPERAKLLDALIRDGKNLKTGEHNTVPSSSQEKPRADPASVTAAHLLIKQAVGQENLAKLANVRERMAGWPRAEQDAALLELQRQGKIGLSSPEGRHKITDEERAAWLRDGTQVYGHVYVR